MVKRWCISGPDEVNVFHHLNRLSVAEYETASLLAYISCWFASWFSKSSLSFRLKQTAGCLTHPRICPDAPPRYYWREIWMCIPPYTVSYDIWLQFPLRFFSENTSEKTSSYYYSLFSSSSSSKVNSTGLGSPCWLKRKNILGTRQVPSG